MSNPKPRQDRVNSTLAKEIDILPSDIHNLEEFLKKMDSMVKNYMDKYSMYMRKDLQKDLALMQNETDLYLMEIAKLRYKLVDYAITTDKEILLGTAVDLDVLSEVNKEEVNEFKEEYETVKEKIMELNSKIQDFIKKSAEREFWERV